jgi:hypothetical protein
MGSGTSVIHNLTHTTPPRPGLFVAEGFMPGSTPLLPGNMPGAAPKEALVVTVGPNCCPQLHSSEDFSKTNALPPSTFVAIVLDPRSLANELSGPFNTAGTSSLPAKARSQWNEFMAFALMAGKKVEVC